MPLHPFPSLRGLFPIALDPGLPRLRLGPVTGDPDKIVGSRAPCPVTVNPYGPGKRLWWFTLYFGRRWFFDNHGRRTAEEQHENNADQRQDETNFLISTHRCSPFFSVNFCRPTLVCTLLQQSEARSRTFISATLQTIKMRHS
jgi:hypothetical protein